MSQRLRDGGVQKCSEVSTGKETEVSKSVHRSLAKCNVAEVS